MTSKNLVDTRKELADLVKRKSEIAVSKKKILMKNLELRFYVKIFFRNSWAISKDKFMLSKARISKILICMET